MKIGYVGEVALRRLLAVGGSMWVHGGGGVWCGATLLIFLSLFLLSLRPLSLSVPSLSTLSLVPLPTRPHPLIVPLVTPSRPCPGTAPRSVPGHGMSHSA